MFEIQNFHIVLEYVRCVYPIEEDEETRTFGFGLKFSDGFYEHFNFKSKEFASEAKANLIRALEDYRGLYNR